MLSKGFIAVFRNSCFLQKFDFYNLVPYSFLIFHIVLKDRKTYTGGIPEINIQTRMPWERSSTFQHGSILCRKSLNNKIHNASTHLKLSNKLQQWASVAEVYYQGRGLQDSEGLHPGRVRNFAGIKIQTCIFMSVATGLNILKLYTEWWQYILFWVSSFVFSFNMFSSLGVD